MKFVLAGALLSVLLASPEVFGAPVIGSEFREGLSYAIDTETMSSILNEAVHSRKQYSTGKSVLRMKRQAELPYIITFNGTLITVNFIETVTQEFFNTIINIPPRLFGDFDRMLLLYKSSFICCIKNEGLTTFTAQAVDSSVCGVNMTTSSTTDATTVTTDVTATPTTTTDDICIFPTAPTVLSTEQTSRHTTESEVSITTIETTSPHTSIADDTTVTASEMQTTSSESVETTSETAFTTINVIESTNIPVTSTSLDTQTTPIETASTSISISTSMDTTSLDIESTSELTSTESDIATSATTEIDAATTSLDTESTPKQTSTESDTATSTSTEIDTSTISLDTESTPKITTTEIDAATTILETVTSSEQASTTSESLTTRTIFLTTEEITETESIILSSGTSYTIDTTENMTFFITTQPVGLGGPETTSTAIGLNDGAIFGIAVGSMAGIMILIVAFFVMMKYRGSSCFSYKRTEKYNLGGNQLEVVSNEVPN